MERISYSLRDKKSQALEELVPKFTNELTPGSSEFLLETADLKLYHYGPETRQGWGNSTKTLTSREGVFIEIRIEDEMYHIDGAINLELQKFIFQSVKRYENGHYVRSRRNKKLVLESAIERLHQLTNE